ncbi:LLM class flavin-dependent oxidoreductase [Nocardia sp. BMG51109]|uniref:LLM class flavin-dependent oxidoreductase n=1 Tax=Nocardia sp. BMG51109 TaxID=1056816 RepID=UPI0004665926|nr:LLM class flavin-dependent oxidoreductase [Nocardia sp. BMG51109]
MPLVIGVDIPDHQLARSLDDGFGRVPELLDAAGVGYVVFGTDRSEPAGPSLNPVLLGTVFARRTTGLGIVAAAAPQRDHPFNLARRIASLDHISGGRAGWLALRADHGIALGAPEQGSWAAPGTPTEAPLLADAVRAARALWRTWPIESLTTEVPARRPPEAEIRYADHTGVFATTGPLNVPTTPQGEPIVLWDYRTGDARNAGTADVAFLSDRDHVAAVTELPDTVAGHVRFDGRDPRLRSRIEQLAAESGSVSGVLIRLDLADLRGFLDLTLPALSDAGIVRLRTAPGTLREHLGIARRTDPDPLRLRPVFASA